MPDKQHFLLCSLFQLDYFMVHARVKLALYRRILRKHVINPYIQQIKHLQIPSPRVHPLISLVRLRPKVGQRISISPGAWSAG